MPVYFMQATEGGPVKIGYSADVDARRAQLEAHYRKPLAVLGVMPGDRREERKIHHQFAHLRLNRTEQFRPGIELMTFIGRPLLAWPNPDDAKTMNGFGSKTGHKEWLEHLHKLTHIPKTVIIRLALIEWAKKNGVSPPPEI